MKVKAPVALVTDFDGTASIDDFFWYAINEYLENSDLKPWNDYIDGKIRHVQALSRIFEKIHVKTEDFHKFIDRFPIEEKFIDTAKLCHEKEIKLFIVSAGADYYIKRILNENINKYNINLVSNQSIYTPELGLKFIEHDKNYVYYDENLGISKVKVIKGLKDTGYYCIFAGDGKPDFDACVYADKIFARKTLLEMCQAEGIKTEKFNSYNDIYDFIKNLEIE
ncbi:MAG: MtnX-like HAD-IB family phosphatase [Candidatus Gastranaerophilaceae bacterium]|jgi:2,3-diketo-5-methylthio-1-phosphopentane phosphatase